MWQKRITIASLVFAFVVIVLGAFTRLSDAGLGCPDWPTCYGHLWVPNSADEIELANDRFAHAPVETDKTWPEQLHRILASSLGLLILSLFVISLRKATRVRSRADWLPNLLSVVALLLLIMLRVILGSSVEPLLWLCMIIFGLILFFQSKKASAIQDDSKFNLITALTGLVILQGLFGMWTVTLKLWPQVVTGHLIGGFTTLCLVWLLALRQGLLGSKAEQVFRQNFSAAKWVAGILLVIVVGQILLGGWTTSNYAALACPDFPRCQNQWWPQADFMAGFNIAQTIGPNYLGGALSSEARIAIHFSHRIGAILVLIVGVATIFQLRKLNIPAFYRLSWVLSLALLTQVSLGVMNVVFSLPLFIAVMHNACGAALLLVVTSINFKIHRVTIRSRSIHTETIKEG